MATVRALSCRELLVGLHECWPTETPRVPFTEARKTFKGSQMVPLGCGLAAEQVVTCLVSKFLSVACTNMWNVQAQSDLACLFGS